MTDEQIKRLRELAEKATPGPWTAKEPAFAPGIKARVFGPTYKGKFEGQETMAVPDADFIAAARNALPELLDEVERLEMENRKLSQHIGELSQHIGDYFYATQETYENMAEEIRVAETNAKVLDKCLNAESAELALRDEELSALRARCERLEARVKELSNPATWRATINRLESAELEALAELDERIAENSALKARVEKLVEAGKQLRAAMIRPIADDVLIEKFKAAEEKWAAALDGVKP